MAKHTSNIWRSVVFAGAMLGTPIVAADMANQPPGTKGDPDGARRLKERLVELDRSIAAAVDEVVAAQNETTSKAARTKLEQLRRERADVDAKLLASTGGEIGRLQVELNTVTAKVDQAVQAVADAQTQADRDAAKAKLASLRTERAAIEKKLIAAKQKAATDASAVGKAQAEVAALDAKIHSAIDAVVTAKLATDRTAAKAKLDALRKDRAAAETRLVAAVEAAKRPRAKEDERPVGRGFILA